MVKMDNPTRSDPMISYIEVQLIQNFKKLVEKKLLAIRIMNEKVSK